MKKGLKITLTIIIIAIIAGTGFIALQIVSSGPDDVIIGNVDFGSVSDGTYQGEYSAGISSAKVEVTALGGQITDIQILEQHCGPGYNADGITDNIIDAQSLEVDTISGATKSSKVMIKAVEVALK